MKSVVWPLLAPRTMGRIKRPLIAFHTDKFRECMDDSARLENRRATVGETNSKWTMDEFKKREEIWTEVHQNRTEPIFADQ
jgi:hypothetical protein